MAFNRRSFSFTSFDKAQGKEFEEGKLSLEDLRTYAIANGEPLTKGGKQEYMENIINRYI